MNKKLMAVAVAGVFAAPAIALAQSSTVQVYGKITYEYGYADLGDDATGASRPKTDIAQTPGGTAIGFRGQEKLGGGLTAWFQCESSADVRGYNQDGLCGRNSALGFKGSWGNLHFGRWDTPFKRAVNMGTVGVQDTGLLGSAFVFAGSSTGTISQTNGSSRVIWKRREGGLTYYESPMFSGFQVLAAFSPGNAATNATAATTSAKPRLYSIGGTFKNGPISAGVGYEKHQNYGNAGGSQSDTGWNISGSYTFNNKLEVGVAYLNTKYDVTPTTDSKKANYIIGLDWSIAGPHGLELGYVKAGKTKGSNTTTIIGSPTSGNSITPNCPGCSTSAYLWEIKYRYRFSKRTTARIGYVYLHNDAHAAYTLGGTSAQTGGQKQNAIVMYLEHSF
jgi:predicted porin